MMTSTIVAPSLVQMAEELDSPSEAVMQLILSSYVLSYGFGPLTWAPLSEVFGRVRIIQTASAWFLLWNIACGFAKSVEMMISGRVFSGLGASAALAVSPSAPTCVHTDLYR
jgi:MFS family permease